MTTWVNHFTKVALALALLAAAPGIAATAETGVSNASDKMAAAEFRQGMRKLWEDHIVWTRLYIVSAAANLPDIGPTAGRLLQNQADIGNGIKPFFGDTAGATLTVLLNDHILGAADLIAAAQSGDRERIDAARTRWYANGDQIAEFLSSANPKHWPLESMKGEMRMHLDLTLAEAVARLQGDYAEDIRLYDEVHDHILNMADVLSNGIVAQFPNRFNQKR